MMVTTAHTRPRGRPRAEDAPASSETILSKSLSAFARYGYDGMSMRTLARDLGVSHNVIPQRFGSKEDLWYAAVDWGFGGLVEAINAGIDPDQTDVMENLRAAIRQFLLYSAEHPELLGIMNNEGSTESARLDYIFDTYVGPATAPLAQLLDALADAGRIRRVPAHTIHFLLSHGGGAPFTLGPLTRRFIEDNRGQVTSDADHADLVADMIVAGLQSIPAHKPTAAKRAKSQRR